MNLPKIGPAFLVTAAFIGPGTVITASLAGANYGFSLLWALLFAVVATIILQEMAARLGIVTQQGLGENIRNAFEHPVLKAISILLVVSAIVIGNGAYQSGNISGASLGLASLIELESILGLASTVLWPFLIGAIAFLLLWTGSYKVIEKALVVLVALMSLAFLLTLLIAQPDFSQLVSGLFSPSIPSGASLTVIALIGTTVVPYNLFLHSASASQKWQSPKQLPDARKDLFLAIPLGGLISIAIVSTAATAFFGESVTLNSVADLAPALQPIAGDMAKILMASGLFAAGISSAVTAPLAAAYALSGILGLNKQLDSNQFKSIWASIIIIGVFVSSIGYRPIEIIWFAQVANGILLPVVTVFLLWLMNTERLKNHRNNWLQNMLGLAVLLVTLILSGRSLMSAFGLL
ncbi:MAG: manganese transport protein [Oceanicoccus sp.]|jgi:manganese transport protein